MKNKTAVLVGMVFLSVLFVLSGMTGAQEQKGQLYSVEEVSVKPAMAAKYEAAVKKEIELGYPYPFETYSTDDFYYYFLTPIDNYAGVDGLNKMEEDWAAKIGPEYEALMQSVEGAINYFRIGVVRFLPELSYAPKKPRFKPEEQKFISWSFAYVEVGKGKEFADVNKQFVELYKSKDTPTGWNTFVVESGTEMPLFFYAEGGRNAAEYFAESEKAMKKVGEEKSTELWYKLLATLRKIETKTGRPRPDLSNMPKK